MITGMNNVDTLKFIFSSTPFDTDKAQKIIDNMLDTQTEQILPFLISYSDSENWAIRTFVYDIFVKTPFTYPYWMLKNGIESRDELFRLATLEIIDSNDRYDCLPLVIHCLEDQYALVRNYAAETIGGLVLSLNNILVAKEKNESDLLAKVGYYTAIYFSGGTTEKEQAFHNLLRIIKDNSSSDYIAKIRAINSLVYISNNEKKLRLPIKASLSEMKSTDLPVSIEDAVDQAIVELYDDV